MEVTSRYGLLRSEAIQFRDKYQCFGVIVSIFRVHGKIVGMLIYQTT